MERKRKPTRLKDFDYSQPNYYYATICTLNHRCLFGKPGNLNSFGEIARWEMEHLSEHHQSVQVDKFVIMPNHIHTILILEENENTKRTLSSILGSYKSAVTKEIHKSAPDLDVWQVSFYDEVIRNEQHYLSVWNYIEGNPSKWEEDKYYFKPR